MPTATEPVLEAGKVYRTRDFAAWGLNAPRLAKRLVREGKLVPLAHGLFAHPVRSRFGDVPPTDHALMRAFLDSVDFVFTGPEQWNALGLGSTAVFATPLVYNTKRSGTFEFAGRRYLLRRVAFPTNPPPEWFVVDLLENAEQAGASTKELAGTLTKALQRGVFDRERLKQMSERFSSRPNAALIEAAIEANR